MKKVSVVAPLGRSALCVSVMAGGLLMCSSEAHAAHWIMSWTAAGNTAPAVYGASNWAEDIKLQRNYDAGSKRVVGVAEFYHDVYQEDRYPQRGSGSEGYDSDDDSSGYWRALAASSKGSITVYLKWVQDAEDETLPPPPKRVLLHFVGNAFATARSKGTDMTATAKLNEVPGQEGTVTRMGTGFYKSTSISDEVRVLKEVPEGKTEVEHTFSLDLKAATSQQNASVYDYSNNWLPRAQVGFYLHVEPVHIDLSISSDIEKSWKKGTGAASALDDPYKKRDANGIMATEIDPNKAVQVAGTGTSNTSDDVWKLLCLPDGKGNMTVDSAAGWASHPDWTWIARLNEDKSAANQNWYGGQGFWFGPARYTANTAGFGSYPNLTWTWSGGTWQMLNYRYPSNGFGGYTDDEPRSPSYKTYDPPLTISNSSTLDMPLRYAYVAGILGNWTGLTDYSVQGLKLGEEDGNTDLPSTTLTVDAQATQNGGPVGIKLTSPSYKVNWHRPEDKWTLRSKTAGPPDVLYDNTTFTVGTSLVRRFPKGGELEIQHPAGTAKLQGVVTAAGAVASLAFPEVPLVARILYLMSGGLGIKAQFIDPTNLAAKTESQDVTISATYQTLGDETRASRNVIGATYPDAAPAFQGVPIDKWRDMIEAFNGPSNQNLYYNGSVDATGSWAVHAHVERNVVYKTLDGDAYNANGYNGPTTSYVTQKGPPLISRTWTWTPAQ